MQVCFFKNPILSDSYQVIFASKLSYGCCRKAAPHCHSEERSDEESRRRQAGSRGTVEDERNMQYYVYILTNKNNRVMYIGVTNDLERRLYEHKQELVDGFTKRYHVHKLVYYEQSSDVRSAIQREKELKGWLRRKKNALVETMNPDWHDLSQDWQ